MGNLVRSTVQALVKPQGPLPKYYNAEEVRQILDAVKGDKELHLTINLLWKTGVRASEALQIRFGDLDPYQGSLRVVTLKKSRRKVRGRKPVREHERITPIKEDLLAEIMTWAHERGLAHQDYLLPFRHRNTLLAKVKKACRLAGFDDDERAHPHTFRHSFAVHLLKNGVPITVVQSLLGHSSLENTAIYLAIVLAEAAQMVRKVEW